MSGGRDGYLKMPDAMWRSRQLRQISRSSQHAGFLYYLIHDYLDAEELWEVTSEDLELLADAVGIKGADIGKAIAVLVKRSLLEKLPATDAWRPTDRRSADPSERQARRHADKVRKAEMRAAKAQKPSGLSDSWQESPRIPRGVPSDSALAEAEAEAEADTGAGQGKGQGARDHGDPGGRQSPTGSGSGSVPASSDAPATPGGATGEASPNGHAGGPQASPSHARRRGGDGASNASPSTSGWCPEHAVGLDEDGNCPEGHRVELANRLTEDPIPL